MKDLVKFNIIIKTLDENTSTEKGLSSGAIPMFLALFVKKALASKGA